MSSEKNPNSSNNEKNTTNNESNFNHETTTSKEKLIFLNCLEKIKQKNYLQTNKEFKCISCFLEKEKFNEKSKPLLIEKDKLDSFEKNIENASIIKKQIKENITLIINELKEKIEIIQNLESKFFDSLEIEIKFSSLLHQYYLEELKNNNLNSFIVKNLENHINFYVPELNINKNDSLKDRINEIISYLNQNISNKFQKLEKQNQNENQKEKEKKNENGKEKEEEEEINENINVDAQYELKTSINFISKGFFEYNKSLFALYDYDTIKFFTKNKFENKITIKESIIKDIKMCQKNEENKIVIFIPKKIFFIQIIEHYNEYMILEQKDINEYNILIFNSKLDLMKFTRDNYEDTFYFYTFPNYLNYKFYKSLNSKYNQFLLVEDNLLFGIKDNSTSLYLINDKECKKLKEYEINIENKDNSAIDISEDFIALNALNKIYLFNKKNNYNLSKTINLEFKSKPITTSIFKINNKVPIVSLFIRENQMKYVNYNILLKGLIWKEVKTKIILNDKILFYNKFDKNHILFMGEKKCFLVEIILNQNNN